MNCFFVSPLFRSPRFQLAPHRGDEHVLLEKQLNLIIFQLPPPYGDELGSGENHGNRHSFNSHPHTGMNCILFGYSHCNALEPAIRKPPKDMRQHPSFPGEILRKSLPQAIREPPTEKPDARGSRNPSSPLQGVPPSIVAGG